MEYGLPFQQLYLDVAKENHCAVNRAGANPASASLSNSMITSKE